MAICGADGGHLAPIRDCAELDKLRLDMHEHIYPGMEIYHVGNFFKNTNPMSARSDPAVDFRTDS